ncbi:MAG: NAD(P)H-quinone oxidoreductase, partial [Ornithinimicrobium sp.]
MRAITIPTPGDADALVPDEVPDPEIGDRDVLIDVVAAGVNRADVAQRQGNYPPP